jgi:ABC-type multidrug transport system fused ATPase/permease subunit
MQPEIRDAASAVELGTPSGAVRFVDVQFAYGNRKPVLRHIDLEVPAGTRVAIVGPTGAGKTTLASLLVRFYDPRGGRIELDGVDLRQIKLASLRGAISVVPQEPLLFSGSIESNIRYGRLDATLDEIVAAAGAANAHEFINALPHGYETTIGERGSGISGGERQRIAVARAFLKDAPILILDEPTSSIDSRTEEVILDALDRLVVGRTSFTIAHRLSTIRDADLIVVMDKGQIMETGTHEELLHRAGLYFSLFEAQSRSRRHRSESVSVETPAAQDPWRARW